MGRVESAKVKVESHVNSSSSLDLFRIPVIILGVTTCQISQNGPTLTQDESVVLKYWYLMLRIQLFGQNGMEWAKVLPE